MSAVYGEKNGSAKLNWDAILLIRMSFNRGYSAKDLAEEFGVCKSHIYKILRKRYWTRRT